MSERRTRFTAAQPCPICGGHDRMDRGCGKRCYGYMWGNGEAAVCTREEHAGALQVYGDTNGYLHALVGDCECGQRHDPRPPSANGHAENGKGPVIVRTYDYHDAAGQLLFQCVRYAPKSFKQRRPDGAGGWLWKLGDVQRVLYRLPELLAADPAEPVLVVEGEKDADTLSARGFVATTSPMGAGKWRKSYAEALGGRDVVVIGDNDDEGRGHAKTVAHSLQGVARSVRVIELDGLPVHGDVSDWIDVGHSVEELRARILVSSFQDSDETRKRENKEFRLTRVSALYAEADEVDEWAMDETLPAGGTSMCVAKPKVGKTTLALNLTVATARGEEFAGRATTKGNVIYLALEEKRRELKKRLRAMGVQDEPIYVHTGSAPDQALEALRRLVEEHKPVLVVIDPIMRLLRLKDVNDYAQVNAAMEPLHQLARSSGAHILCVHHAGKGERIGGDAVLGSTALFAAVDTLLIMRTREAGRTVQSIQRYGEDLPETVVALDTATWKVSAAGNVADVLAQQVADAIIAAVGDEALTEAEIREKAGKDARLTTAVLRALVKEERLVRTGEGVKGDPYRYTKPKPTRAAPSTANTDPAPQTEAETAEADQGEEFSFSRFDTYRKHENEKTSTEPAVEWVDGPPCWTCKGTRYWLRPAAAGSEPVCACCHPPGGRPEAVRGPG